MPLAGGFSTVVVRSGGTVRRTASPWTPAVHALLDHLDRVGFGRAPVPLGVDEQGREVLGYLDGTVAWWPWPAVLRTDDGLRQVARLVRDLAAAVSTFDEPADAVWHGGLRGGPDLVLRHGDLGPWNTLWHGDQLVALIDWDTAEPAPPGWDAAQAAWFFVPLRPASGDRADGQGFTEAEVEHRFALWCREVDLSPGALLGLLDDVQEFDRRRLLELGGAGVEPYATFLARGDLDSLAEDVGWLARWRSRLSGQDVEPPLEAPGVEQGEDEEDREHHHGWRPPPGRTTEPATEATPNTPRRTSGTSAGGPLPDCQDRAMGSASDQGAPGPAAVGRGRRHRHVGDRDRPRWARHGRTVTEPVLRTTRELRRRAAASRRRG